MTDIVINVRHGGYGLSEDARSRLIDLGVSMGEYPYEVPRDDPNLVRVVREMGPGANGEHAQLIVVKVPDDVDWTIEEYDGYEHIAEKHRTWP